MAWTKVERGSLKTQVLVLAVLVPSNFAYTRGEITREKEVLFIVPHLVFPTLL